MYTANTDFHVIG